MAKKKLAGRKKPRQERSVATVEAILQAATYILTERGWSAFTTNEVAQKAGVNIASLYQYFPNKESIVAELQRRHVQEIEQHWPDPPKDLSLPEYIRTMLDAVVSEHRINPALHRVFADELPRSNRLGVPRSDAQVRWGERVAPLVKVPDVGLATFITGVVVHAVIHEAATERPELLDHPLLVPEPRAGALDLQGREALLRYVLRPPLAQSRLSQRPDGLVRIALKRAYSDGSVAVEMDPLSLLCRLAMSVPAPRFHTVKYAGVLAPASAWRSRITPKPKLAPQPADAGLANAADMTPQRASRYRPWAQLLTRTFGMDVLQCPQCQGRMKLLAMLTDPSSVARYLAKLGEPTHLPARAAGRGPPYWKSTVLRQKAGNGSM